MRKAYLASICIMLGGIVVAQEESRQIIPIRSADRTENQRSSSTAMPVTNDVPCDAITLTNGNCMSASTFPTTNYTTTGATTSTTGTGTVPVPGCWSSGFSTTVWYKFTATATSQKISTDVQLAGGGVNNANQIAVYRSSNGACSGNFTLIGCNDDICDCSGPGSNDQAEVTVTGLTVGQTYWIAVDGDGTSDGTFRICTQAAQSNDGCSTAQAMTSGTVYNSSNVGASAYTGSANTGDVNFTCGSTENMVFYTFTSPTTGTYYLEQSAQTCSGSGTQVMVFRSTYTCGTLPENPIEAASTTYELVCSAASTAYRYFTMSLTAGQTYIIGVDGYAGDECTYRITIGPVIVLPVELLSFKAIPEDNGVVLLWETATETNNDYFSVERSFNGNEWATIGTVKGSGNSNERLSYSFLDTNPFGGTSYYRIRQNDYNQKFSFSDVVAVAMNAELDPLILVTNVLGQKVPMDYPGLKILKYRSGKIVRTMN